MKKEITEKKVIETQQQKTERDNKRKMKQMLEEFLAKRK